MQWSLSHLYKLKSPYNSFNMYVCLLNNECDQWIIVDRVHIYALFLKNIKKQS